MTTASLITETISHFLYSDGGQEVRVKAGAWVVEQAETDPAQAVTLVRRHDPQSWTVDVVTLPAELIRTAARYLDAVDAELARFFGGVCECGHREGWHAEQAWAENTGRCEAKEDCFCEAYQERTAAGAEVGA